MYVVMYVCNVCMYVCMYEEPKTFAKNYIGYL